MPTITKAVAQLASLGNSDDIAKHLEYLGVTGIRNSPIFCPIAQYLKAETGIHIDAVCNGKIRAFDTEWIHVATPPVITEFIFAFDSGSYTNLEAASK